MSVSESRKPYKTNEEFVAHISQKGEECYRQLLPKQITTLHNLCKVLLI